MNNEDTALAMVADTTMPTALHKVYVGLPLELVALVERERIEMIEDTFEHLKRIHAMLAPYRKFAPWCEAAGIRRNLIHERKYDTEHRQRPATGIPSSISEPQRIEPGDEPHDYAVVNQYPPEPPAFTRQESETAITPYLLPEPTPHVVERMSRAYEQIAAVTADDIAAWLRVAPLHHQDELLRRIDLIRSVILEAGRRRIAG